MTRSIRPNAKAITASVTQTSEAKLSPAAGHIHRFRHRHTSPRWVCSTSPCPRAQRRRCAQRAPRLVGTCMPTSAFGSYAVIQPASSRRQESSMSSVAIRPSKPPALEHRPAPEDREHPGDRADPPDQPVGAADQPDDRGGLERLDRGEQPPAVGHVRRAGDGGDPRRALDPRDEQLQRQRVEVRVGVGDDDELVPRPLEAAIELLRLAPVDLVADHLEPRIALAGRRGDGGGRVGGAVVEDDQLELRIVARERRPHGRLDHRLLVVGGDQDGDPRPAAGRLLGLVALVEPREEQAARDPGPGRDDRKQPDEEEQDLNDRAAGSPCASSRIRRRRIGTSTTIASRNEPKAIARPSCDGLASRGRRSRG